MTTDLVSRLRAHAARDNCTSYDWGGEQHEAGNDCADAADELDRLERERSEWAGIAATRNRNIALIAEERDRYRLALSDLRNRLIEVNAGLPEPGNIDTELIASIDCAIRRSDDVSGEPTL